MIILYTIFLQHTFLFFRECIIVSISWDLIHCLSVKLTNGAKQNGENDREGRLNTKCYFLVNKDHRFFRLYKFHSKWVKLTRAGKTGCSRRLWDHWSLRHTAFQKEVLSFNSKHFSKPLISENFYQSELENVVFQRMFFKRVSIRLHSDRCFYNHNLLVFLLSIYAAEHYLNNCPHELLLQFHL